MEQTFFYNFMEGLSHYGSGGLALISAMYSTKNDFRDKKLELTGHRAAVSTATILLVSFSTNIASIAVFNHFTR